MWEEVCVVSPRSALKYLLFIIALVTVALSRHKNNCLQTGSIITGKYLQNSSFAKFPKSTLYSCAAQCLGFIICRSFNFNTFTKACFLNFATEASEQDLLRNDTKLIYSDVSCWPQCKDQFTERAVRNCISAYLIYHQPKITTLDSKQIYGMWIVGKTNAMKQIAGPCQGHTCGREKRCVVGRNGSTICTTFSDASFKTEFELVKERLNWTEAVDACSKLPGNLAIVDTQNKHDAVLQLDGVNDDLIECLWLGATDVQEEGVWLWVDGRNMTFSMWRLREPDNFQDDQHCLCINPKVSRWQDRICQDNIFGACKSHTCRKEEKCTVTRNSSIICARSPSYEKDYKLEFVLSKKKMTWNESLQECSRLNGSLAVIDTGEKHIALKKVIMDSGLNTFVWLGASDFEEEGRWMWVNGHQMTFNSWAQDYGQPSNNSGRQHCLVTVPRNQSIIWFDWYCGYSFHFVCEFVVLI